MAPDSQHTKYLGSDPCVLTPNMLSVFFLSRLSNLVIFLLKCSKSHAFSKLFVVYYVSIPPIVSCLLRSHSFYYVPHVLCLLIKLLFFACNLLSFFCICSTYSTYIIPFFIQSCVYCNHYRTSSVNGK